MTRTIKASLIVICTICFVGSTAQAADLNYWKRQGMAACMSGESGFGGNSSPAYCKCLVDTWVELWNDEDNDYWQNTGGVTPHMRAMEERAQRRCAREQ